MIGYKNTISGGSSIVTNQNTRKYEKWYPSGIVIGYKNTISGGSSKF